MTCLGLHRLADEQIGGEQGEWRDEVRKKERPRRYHATGLGMNPQDEEFQCVHQR